MRRLLTMSAALMLAGCGDDGQAKAAPAACADPAACEAANKIAYANAAKNEEERKAREKEWAAGVLALRMLRAAMHDPGSFQVDQVLRMPDKTLCVTYRARNGFGALRLGRFVLAPTAGASDSDSKFATLWNRHCGGKRGEDISYIRRAI